MTQTDAMWLSLLPKEVEQARDALQQQQSSTLTSLVRPDPPPRWLPTERAIKVALERKVAGVDEVGRVCLSFFVSHNV